MSKMNIELGGRYTAGQVFSKAQADIKKFGRDTKDVGQIGTTVFDTITSKIDGPVSNAMGNMSGLVKGLASGGLWGMVASAAGMAIGFIVDKFKEAQEQAKKFGEYMSDKFVKSMRSVNEEYANTKREIDEVQKAAEDAVGVLSGKAAADLANKVYEIHTQALQKVTDDMTEKGKAVVAAEEKVEQAQAKSAIMFWDNYRKVEAANERVLAAKEKVAEAENAVAQSEALRNEAEVKNAVVVANRRAIQERIAKLEEQHENQEIGLYAYREQMGKILAAKAKFEENNSTTLKNLDAVEAEYQKALANQTAAERELEQATNAHKLAKYKATESRTQHTAAIEEAKLQQQKANELLAKENKEKEDALAREKEQTEARMQAEELYNQLIVEDIGISERAKKLKVDEAYFVQKWNELRASGLSVEEATIELNQEYKEYKKAETKITKICQELKVDEKEYLKEFLKQMDSGVTEAEAYAELQNKLNEELKKRKEAEEKATKASEDSANGDDKEGKNKKGMVVSLSTSNMGDLSDKVEDKLSFKDWQRKNRDEQRKARDAKNNMKIDQAKMTKALKGEMPEEEAKQWMEYAKKKYTPDQMKELGKLAMNKQLLSKSENKRQLKAVEQMANTIKQALAIK